MQYVKRVEYKQSGTRWWKVIFAPVWVLVLIGRSVGRCVIQIGDRYEPTHMDILLKNPHDTGE